METGVAHVKPPSRCRPRGIEGCATGLEQVQKDTMIINSGVTEVGKHRVETAL